MQEQCRISSLPVPAFLCYLRRKSVNLADFLSLYRHLWYHELILLARLHCSIILWLKSGFLSLYIGFRLNYRKIACYKRYLHRFLWKNPWIFSKIPAIYQTINGLKYRFHINHLSQFQFPFQIYPIFSYSGSFPWQSPSKTESNSSYYENNSKTTICPYTHQSSSSHLKKKGKKYINKYINKIVKLTVILPKKAAENKNHRTRNLSQCNLKNLIRSVLHLFILFFNRALPFLLLLNTLPFLLKHLYLRLPFSFFYLFSSLLRFQRIHNKRPRLQRRISNSQFLSRRHIFFFLLFLLFIFFVLILFYRRNE